MKRRLVIGVLTITTLLSLILWTKPAEAAPGICSTYGYVHLSIPSHSYITVLLGASTLSLPVNNSVFVQDSVTSGSPLTANVTAYESSASTQVSNPRPFGVTAWGWSGFAVEC